MSAVGTDFLAQTGNERHSTVKAANAVARWGCYKYTFRNPDAQPVLVLVLPNSIIFAVLIGVKEGARVKQLSNNRFTFFKSFLEACLV